MRWSDGNLQSLIGNEVLDISVQDAQHDQAQLLLSYAKVNSNIPIGFLYEYLIYFFFLIGA